MYTTILYSAFGENKNLLESSGGLTEHSIEVNCPKFHSVYLPPASSTSDTNSRYQSVEVMLQSWSSIFRFIISSLKPPKSLLYILTSNNTLS